MTGPEGIGSAVTAGSRIPSGQVLPGVRDADERRSRPCRAPTSSISSRRKHRRRANDGSSRSSSPTSPGSRRTPNAATSRTSAIAQATAATPRRHRRSATAARWTRSSATASWPSSVRPRARGRSGARASALRSTCRLRRREPGPVRRHGAVDRDADRRGDVGAGRLRRLHRPGRHREHGGPTARRGRQRRDLHRAADAPRGRGRDRVRAARADQGEEQGRTGSSVEGRLRQGATLCPQAGDGARSTGRKAELKRLQEVWSLVHREPPSV